jgi:hypothetical protein
LLLRRDHNALAPGAFVLRKRNWCIKEPPMTVAHCI